MNLHSPVKLWMMEVNEFRVQHKSITGGVALIELIANDGVPELLAVNPQLM